MSKKGENLGIRLLLCLTMENHLFRGAELLQRRLCSRGCVRFLSHKTGKVTGKEMQQIEKIY